MTLGQPIILAGDIGGTKANLAFYQLVDGQLHALASTTKKSRDYNILADLTREFIASVDIKADFVCMSVAGPVIQRKCRATNLPWVIDADEIAQGLNFRSFELMNDLEANAHGIYELGEDQFEVLNAGNKKLYGNVAVISAGTGLGEAGILWSDHKLLPFASEGGHADFAPTNELQVELLEYLAQKEAHVSCERVLSGKGLQNIYEFLRDCNKFSEEEWLSTELKRGDPPAVISEIGLTGKSPICTAALNIFTEIYGAEAGNLALKLMATGGVFIGGGIAPKIITKLKEPRFLEAFLNKGRLNEVLEVMPIKVIMNDKSALLGAARCALLHAGILHHTRMG